MKLSLNSLAGGVALIVIGVLLVILMLVLAGVLPGAGKADPAADLSAKDRAAIETVVREYILANPEVIPEAMQNLQRGNQAAALAKVRDRVETPFPGAVLGNPNGSVTLVEFSDFACGYCRASLADVEALIAEHPDLRVVVHELPIISDQSEPAARMALAAAEQGKFEAFHHALFSAGQLSAATIEQAARAAGLNLARARTFARSDKVDAAIATNMQMAGELGFNGTPAWIVGDAIIAGAVGKEALAEAIAEARS